MGEKKTSSVFPIVEGFAPAELNNNLHEEENK